MAPVKPAAKKPAKKTGTSVVAWDEKLAAKAAMAKKAEASVSTGSFISLKGGIMAYGGNPVPDNKLRVIVLDSILENQFFEGKYDPSSPNSPSCYAFGRDEDEMSPHEAVEDPQCETCSGCPNNEWASGEGRGKACKNVRRLALIPEDVLEDGAEGIKDAEVAFLKLPVTSVKAWAGYVNQLAATEKPPLAFVTEICVTPDAASQFKVSFKAVEEVDDGDLIGALLEKADIVEQQIAFPYQKVEAPSKPASRARSIAKPARAAAKPARTAAKPARAAAPGRATKPETAAPVSGRRKF